MREEFIQELTAALPDSRILRDEPMSRHTTFGIGGPADLLVLPAHEQALREGLQLCKQADIPCFIAGNGSNLLVGDGGFRGVIFKICHTMDAIESGQDPDSGRLLCQAGAGAMLSVFARQVSQLGFAGAEFATGIPGTIGGAVTMNAGAYQGEIADSILWADMMDGRGQVIRMDRNQLHLSYRHSVVMEQDLIVLRAAFSFEKGDPGQIEEKIRDLSRARREKQPLEYPSAGSTFKRPEGAFAGKLIEDSGLKGFAVGDAQVSEKHCGFLINRGGASAADMRQLIARVQERVYETSGIRLEPEVRFLGAF